MVWDTVLKLTNLNFFLDMFKVEYLWTYDLLDDLLVEVAD